VAGKDDAGKSGSAKSVQDYIAGAFGDRLLEWRAAMGTPAGSLPPAALNRLGFRVYERFRL